MQAYGANVETNWYIYDNLNDLSSTNLNAAKAILHMIYPDDESVHVNCVRVFEQPNSNDCGLYAIAFAHSLLKSEDPGKLHTWGNTHETV